MVVIQKPTKIMGVIIDEQDIPTDQQVLTFNDATSRWIAADAAGVGEANTSSNSGAGEGLALAKVGVDLPFKSITAGTNITLTGSATELEIAASGGAGLTFSRVVKSIDESVTNSTTLQDDDELLFTPTINKTYGYVLLMLIENDAAPDIKRAFTVPTGATIAITNANLSSVFLNATADGTSSSSSTGTSGSKFLLFFGRVIMSGTAGNVVLQWAQNTTSANAETVREGSYLVTWEEA